MIGVGIGNTDFDCDVDSLEEPEIAVIINRQIDLQWIRVLNLYAHPLTNCNVIRNWRGILEHVKRIRLNPSCTSR